MFTSILSTDFVSFTFLYDSIPPIRWEYHTHVCKSSLHSYLAAAAAAQVIWLQMFLFSLFRCVFFCSNSFTKLYQIAETCVGTFMCRKEIAGSRMTLQLERALNVLTRRLILLLVAAVTVHRANMDVRMVRKQLYSITQHFPSKILTRGFISTQIYGRYPTALITLEGFFLITLKNCGGGASKNDVCQIIPDGSDMHSKSMAYLLKKLSHSPLDGWSAATSKSRCVNTEQLKPLSHAISRFFKCFKY